MDGPQPWQTSNVERRRSYLTEREVLVNVDETRFLLLTDTFSTKAFGSALGRMGAYWKTLDYDLRPSGHLASMLAKAGVRPDLGAMTVMLDFIFAEVDDWTSVKKPAPYEKTAWKRRTDMTRLKELFTALYSEALILFPRDASTYFRKSHIDFSELGAAGKVCQAWRDAAVAKRAHATPAIGRIMLGLGGVTSVGDLSPDVLQGTLAAYGITRVSLASGLFAEQRKLYGDAVRHNVESFVDVGRKALRGRDGRDFAWALAADATLDSWCTLAIRYLGTVTSVSPAQVALNGFLDYLVANPSVPRSPVDYMSRAGNVFPAFKTDKPVTNNLVRDFLDWILDTALAEEDAEGLPVRSRSFVNPIERQIKKEFLSESSRSVMPSRFVRMALEILKDNDWEWSRTVSKADRSLVFNAGEDRWETHWCPVRAMVLNTLLQVPLRVFQVVSSDSGEGDTEVYEASSGTMVPNQGRCRPIPGKQPAQRGIMQVLSDPVTRLSRPVLRLTTNKTADIGKEHWEKGYDCPYAPETLLGELASLRDWQAAHNPVEAPTPWSEVKEYMTGKNPENMAGLSSYFLFRDAASKRPGEPVTYARIYQFFLALMAELESLLETLGIKNDDGTAIKLISTWVEGRPSKAAYDLHTLRVTLVTLFYEEGKIPAEVLMKIVGHSTIVMTLYYIKLGQSFVQDEMSRAEMLVREAELVNWTNYQRSCSMESLRASVVSNDQSGLDALVHENSASTQLMNVGLCPVGCGRCASGGKRLSGSDNRMFFGSVPGGRNNCGECRFLITGPPFQKGIQAEFNARSLAQAGLTRQRDVIATRFEELDGERRRSMAAKAPFTSQREWSKAENELEDITARVDQLSREMVNLAALDFQINTLNSKLEHADGREALQVILNDPASVSAAFAETTDFDLADRVCLQSSIYPSIPIQEANHLRILGYDRMLRRNGLPPVFLEMDDDTALHAGNQLTRLLSKSASRKHVVGLVDGTHTLSDLGILPATVMAKLQEACDVSLTIAPPLPVRQALLEHVFQESGQDGSAANDTLPSLAGQPHVHAMAAFRPAKK